MTLLTTLLATLSLVPHALSTPTILPRQLPGLPPELSNNHTFYGAPPDDYTCQSPHNPIVLLHSMAASRELGLNMLAQDLRANGYCTFSMTYGAPLLLPWIGGLTDMRDSAAAIASYISGVADAYPGKKVDIVGHSEGGAQALYVPLMQAGIAEKIERIVALAPAVHGADYYGVTGLLGQFGPVVKSLAQAAIALAGCQACVDMMGGPDAPGKVYLDFQNAERITQAGNKVTIIMSRGDTLVPPVKSEVFEEGVRNVYVQDGCPNDPVGHFGMVWDKGVWALVKNALTEEYDAPVECVQGLPI